jgi:hypothetical protein
MKTTLLTLFAALVLVAAAHAQGPIAIDELRAPTSPAFVLLDVTPAAVERPESPKAFAVNLINAVSEAEGLPQNYAFEVAPYWLASHPALSFEKYQNPGAMGIIHTLSFSVATTPMIADDESVADPLGTRLGIGVRANLLNGRVNPKLTQLVDELKGLQENVLDILKEQDDATVAVEKAEEDVAAVRSEGRSASELGEAVKALRATQARLDKALAG